MRKTVVLVLVFLVLLVTAASAAKYSYVDLVKKLTDMEGLAVLPDAGEKCAQWSSYDRASVYDTKAGKYLNWDANGDGTGFIRMEGDQQVLAEMQGPGCIWRIWSADPRQGHVRIYLDGATEPAVDLQFKEYFDLNNAPFVYPSLVHNTSKGQNCYVPIPYQKSCKITADKDWGRYFHFTYTTYPKGTVLPTFKRALSDSDKAALKAADEQLTNGLGIDPKTRMTVNKLQLPVAIRSGSKMELTRLNGAYAITSIKLNGSPSSYSAEKLRNTILRIYWDGEKEPSVWVPLGDFFGTAPGANKYKSLPAGVTDQGFYSFWYMPFAKSAVVELANVGETAFVGQVEISYSPLDVPLKKLGRFHAKWHRDAFLPGELERQIDWTMLKTQGRGRFCGVMLEVWNPRGGWWGEGDEKFFVDGEKFPSTIGTGSEDYFGYAWCNPTLFQNAYHNQTISENNAGHISVNRWHITDNVPFQKSFEGDIEKYYKNFRPTQYACTAYWYLEPGQADDYKPSDTLALNDMYINRDIFKVAGALEGESLKVLERTSGNVARQELTGNWSNETQLFWLDGKPGDKLTLALPVKEAGKYDVKLELTKANDYGIVQLYLDGQKLGEPVDLYDPQIVQTGLKSYGTFDLTADKHKLEIEIVGANEKAIKRYMFGLDYVLLVPGQSK